MTTVLPALTPTAAIPASEPPTVRKTVYSSPEARPLPDSGALVRTELVRPPWWILAGLAGLLLVSVGLSGWYGTRIRSEVFDLLAASLLTMIGVVPGFASLLFVDRPVLLLDRGRVAVRGWVTPMLIGYGTIWLAALVLSLACATTDAPSPDIVRIAMGSSLMTTLFTPLAFAAVLRRLGHRASTEAVVAVAIAHDKTSDATSTSARHRRMLAKNLRDVAIREFDAGDRPGCEERLWGLASIAALADDPSDRENATNELAYVVEFEVLQDRDLAMVGLAYLGDIAVRRAELRHRVAEHLIDILGATITREEVSGRVLKLGHELFGGIADQPDEHLLDKLVEIAEAAPIKCLPSHLDLLLQSGRRAMQDARERPVRSALKLVERLDSTPHRVDYRLELLDLFYGETAGPKKLQTIRGQAKLLAPDLLAGADGIHPTAPLARTEIRRSFKRGTRSLYFALAEAMIDVEIDLADGAADPRGAMLGEYLLAAVRAQDQLALQELDNWIAQLEGVRLARLAPATLVALRSVRDEINRQTATAPPGPLPEATAIATDIFNEWCWRAIRVGVQRQQPALADSALTTWCSASGKIHLSPTKVRTQALDAVALLLQESTDMPSEVELRLRPAVLRAAPSGRLPSLVTALYSTRQVASLSNEEVGLLLLASHQIETSDPEALGYSTTSSPIDVGGEFNLYEWLTDWLKISRPEEVYQACDSWVTEGQSDLAVLESAFFDWARETHPGPALLLGIKARGIHRDEGPLSNETWEWLTSDAAALLNCALRHGVPEEHRYLTFCTSTWYRLALAGLAEGRLMPHCKTLVRAVTSNYVLPHVITSSLRFSAVRNLPKDAREALAPALVDSGYPFLSLRLHRGLRSSVLKRTLAIIEDLVGTDEQPPRAAERALQAVRSYGAGNLVKHVGPTPVRSLLAACASRMADASGEHAALAQQLLREADLASKGLRPAGDRTPPTRPRSPRR
ncbi:hypothetical protein [Nocardioides donggukensis]|uniref:Uncharacterized protein n=1 Tax=Nocardioides donggukensis TaxID=2774019 RepID=A0A927PZT9_9ACTN|nr:hypothetical protein [Nocardioides donggukensis]MBD8868037.1 hypothetical protein [Nocardioides donggukensis]